MRYYEVMFIARPDLDDEASQALVDRITNLINTNGGEVEKVEPTKRQRMAYEIQHYREGLYTVVNFKGEPRTAEELDRVLKITDGVLRHMIVRLKDKEKE
ncbi:MAG TPA: 30S ribosomal protein S6 [Symbiobacteriaceae bacterium]